MGTRAMILVVGRSSGTDELGADKAAVEAIRLHTHAGGGPDNVLDDLAKATRYAAGFLDERKQYLSMRLRREATVEDLSAGVWSECVRFAGLGLYGPTTILDALNVEDRHDPGSPRAVFRGDAALDDNQRWGDQGDLEWMYLVDITGRKVTVYGGDYADPEEHLRVGPVDPRCYALEFHDDKRPEVFLGVGKVMTILRSEGWNITPGIRKRGLSTPRMYKLKYRSLCRLMVELKPDWRTEAVTGLTQGILADRAFDRCPVLADALGDAGCFDGDLMAKVRSLAA